ncbi:MAG: GTP-binding protein [Candidatus Altiarchaeota archaeon]
MPHRRFIRWLSRMLRFKKNLRVGIYGPPNSGKTSLANRIITDCIGGAGWAISDIPHETRHVHGMEEVVLESGKSKLMIDLFDMPGISSREELHTDYFDEFLSASMNEDEARLRLLEATEGIAESVRWMKRIDSAIVVLDSTKNPYTKVNALLLGILKAYNVNMIVAANKIDLDDAKPDQIEKAMVRYPVVRVSAKEGTNMDELYKAISQHLR